MINSTLPNINLLPHIRTSNTDEKVLVDFEDYPSVSRHRWAKGNSGYAQRGARINGKSTTVSIHRQVMKTPPGMTVDHIYGDKLDNRKANLRNCTHSQNLFNQGKSKANTSGYKGVSYNAKQGKWGTSIRLGSYDTPEEAALAYNRAAKILHGEYANLNDVKEEPLS